MYETAHDSPKLSLFPFMKVLLVSMLPSLTLGQARCQLAHVRQSDGSFRLGFCDELSLSGEHVGDDGAVALALALADDQRLRMLDLWSNGIGPSGATALAAAIAANSKLDKLYLNENKIGVEGATALAEGIGSPKSALTTLWLSRNGLGDAGAVALANGLSKYKARRLQVLDLWENGITAKGGKSLAEALRTNGALVTLELRGNSLGDDGAWAFASLMPNSRALSTLDLSSNGITPAGAQVLLEGLKRSSSHPYLVLFVEHVPHMQATSWEQQGRQNAP